MKHFKALSIVILLAGLASAPGALAGARNGRPKADLVEYSFNPGPGILTSVWTVDPATSQAVAKLAEVDLRDKEGGEHLTFKVERNSYFKVIVQCRSAWYKNSAFFQAAKDPSTAMNYTVYLPNPVVLDGDNDAVFNPPPFLNAPNKDHPEVIAPGQSTFPPARIREFDILKATEPGKPSTDIDLLKMRVQGPWIQTRRDFPWAMFICRARVGMASDPADAAKELDKPIAAVTGVYTFSRQPYSVPDTTDARWEMFHLWRWSEVDWEFVPKTWNQQLEHIEYSGAFPNAVGQVFGANGEDSRPTFRFDPVLGRDYTDDTLARSIGVTGGKPGITSFQTLLDNTKDADPCTFLGGVKWPIPASMALPQRDKMEHMVAVNVFRMADGTHVRTFPALGITQRLNPKTAKSDTREMGDFSLHGFAQTNETYVVNTAKADGRWVFDPYRQYHTYTIVTTPAGILMYIDAGPVVDGEPQGWEISGATPVKVYDFNDYPSMDKGFGQRYEGGELKWKPNEYTAAGQQQLVDDPAGELTVGYSQFSFNMWFSDAWSGFPDYQMSGDPTSIGKGLVFDPFMGNSYIKFAAVYPMVTTGVPLAGVNESLFNRDKNSPAVLYSDFSSMTEDDWWFHFRKEFIAEHGDDGTKSINDVAFATDPLFRNKALRMIYTFTGNTEVVKPRVFKLTTPATPTSGPQKDHRLQATVTDPGDPDKVYANAISTNRDYFTLPKAYVDDPAKKLQVLLRWWDLDDPQGLAADSAVLELTNNGYRVVSGNDSKSLPSSKSWSYVGFTDDNGDTNHVCDQVVIAPGLPPAPRLGSLDGGRVKGEAWVENEGTANQKIMVKLDWTGVKTTEGAWEPAGTKYYAWFVGSVNPCHFSPGFTTAATLVWDDSSQTEGGAYITMGQKGKPFQLLIMACSEEPSPKITGTDKLTVHKVVASTIVNVNWRP